MDITNNSCCEVVKSSWNLNASCQDGKPERQVCVERSDYHRGFSVVNFFGLPNELIKAMMRKHFQ